MGFTCFKCDQHINGNASNLLNHFRLHHNLVNGGMLSCPVTCGQEGCQRTYYHTWSLKRHLNSQHYGLIALDQRNFPQAHMNRYDVDEIEDGGDAAVGDDVDLEAQQWELFNNEEMETRALNLVCAMKSSTSVVQSTVNLVVDHVSDMFVDLVGYLKYRTSSAATELDIDTGSDTFQELLMEMDSLQYPFRQINTSYKQRKTIESSACFVKPSEVPTTMGYVPRLNPSSGAVRQVMSSKTFQYIPIKEMLKLVLQSPGYMECIQELKQSEDGLIRDFIDGKHYSNSQLLRQETTIRLLLFVDDAEVTNPLSPRAGTHKLGMMYFSIKSLPARFLSSLNNLFLLAIYKSADAKDFGIDEILQPFLRDMRSLQEDGLFIESPSFTGIVRVGIAQIVGDNLGIHSLFGFAEGFTANYFCRKCRGHRDQLRVQTKEDHCILRDRENYAEDLIRNSLPETGIKSATPLNNLMDFHVTQNYAHDIMHDLLEGVCPLELKLVLSHLINEGKFSLSTLNARITSFDYGFADASNRPCGIPQRALQNPDGSTGQHAGQMWCLIRNLPLMMGDLIEEGNEYWELILLLLHCMDLIFAPVISPEETLYMKHLIQDHHKLFLKLFPDRNLRPKHHFMLHYPRAIREVGPMYQFWSMIFEAKHNYFKRIAHITCNFKNIAKTMAHRHQMNVCFQLTSGKSLQQKELEIGTGYVTVLASLEHCDEISIELRGFPLLDDIFVANWCKFYGMLYRPGMMVVIDKDNDLNPQFGKILHLLVDEHQGVMAVTENWDTSGFERHLHAYTVERVTPTSITVISLKELLDVRPLHATKSYSQDGMWFISPRYKL